jgi:hypothetical protein
VPLCFPHSLIGFTGLQLQLHFSDRNQFFHQLLRNFGFWHGCGGKNLLPLSLKRHEATFNEGSSRYSSGVVAVRKRMPEQREAHRK